VEEAVFVADSVIILSSQPASIVNIININLGRERSHGTKAMRDYARLVRDIDDILEQGHP